MWCKVIVFSSHSEGNSPKAWVLLAAPSPAKLTLALKVVILMHWSPAGSAKDKWHLADDAASFETLEIFHHQQKGRGKKCLLSYPVASMCLPTFGYPNKLPHGKKDAWILISCCYSKVNEKGAGRKAERLLHHSTFMTAPPYSLQGQYSSCSSWQACSRETGCVCFSMSSKHSLNRSDSLSEVH